MANSSSISKMFGALVLGGCMHQGTPANADSDQNATKTTASTPATENTDSTVVDEAAPATSDSSEARPPEDYCQLKFTHHKYTRFNAPGATLRNKVESVITCLDEKSEEEILKIINAAKKQTCETPFCGCWLG